jgi:hypothetical protein
MDERCHTVGYEAVLGVFFHSKNTRFPAQIPCQKGGLLTKSRHRGINSCVLVEFLLPRAMAGSRNALGEEKNYKCIRTETHQQGDM